MKDLRASGRCAQEADRRMGARAEPQGRIFFLALLVGDWGAMLERFSVFEPRKERGKA
jgi:hypothetical protein